MRKGKTALQAANLPRRAEIKELKVFRNKHGTWFFRIKDIPESTRNILLFRFW